jgi:hypothetical protein
MSVSGFVRATILKSSNDLLSDIAFKTSATEIEVIIPYVTVLRSVCNIVTSKKGAHDMDPNLI